MMKKIARIMVVLLMLVSLSACGGASESDDPNVGMWNAISASMLGMTSDIEEIFEQGASLELKDNGKFTLTLDGEKANGEWGYDENNLAFTSYEFDFWGTIENDILTLENLMDTGLSLMFQKSGSDAAVEPDSE